VLAPTQSQDSMEGSKWMRGGNAKLVRRYRWLVGSVVAGGRRGTRKHLIKVGDLA
jgi:hypothetical protein